MEPQNKIMCDLVPELCAAPLTWTNELSTSQKECCQKVQGDKASTAHASSKNITLLLLLQWLQVRDVKTWGKVLALILS